MTKEQTNHLKNENKEFQNDPCFEKLQLEDDLYTEVTSEGENKFRLSLVKKSDQS